MSKDHVLKSTFIAILVLFPFFGAVAVETMHVLPVSVSVILGLYIIIFTFINRGKWIFE